MEEEGREEGKEEEGGEGTHEVVGAEVMELNRYRGLFLVLVFVHSLIACGLCRLWQHHHVYRPAL